MQTREEYQKKTSVIIGSAIEIHRVVGPGLLESTYERCLAYKLEKAGLSVRRQIGLSLRFEELVIPNAHRVDLLIDDAVLIEVKAVDSLSSVHFAQVLTYLRILNLRVGILINFNTACLKDGIHRVVNAF